MERHYKHKEETNISMIVQTIFIQKENTVTWELR